MRVLLKNTTNILFFLTFLFFYGCHVPKPKITLNSNVVKNNLIYIENKYPFSAGKIDGKKVAFTIDIGSVTTVISPEHGEKTKFNARVSDFNGEKKQLFYHKIKEFKWGELTINDLFAVVTDTTFVFWERRGFHAIMGTDILKNYCVKFDHNNKLFLISDSVELISPKGIKIPFDFSSGRIYFPLIINGEEVPFLFDSGFTGDLSIDKQTFSLLDKQTNLTHWKDLSGGLFYKGNPVDMIFGLIDIQLKEKVLSKALFEHRELADKNVVGTVFMQRFKSITIDYPARNLYFELPDDYKVTPDYNYTMTFSQREIKDVPVAYTNLFFSKINSLGLGILETYPFTVYSVETRLEYKDIAVGDTLIGINNVFFSDSIILPNDKSIRIELDKDKQAELIKTVFSQKNSAVFHFYKHNKLLSVTTYRKNIEKAPIVAYEFYMALQNLNYYGINLFEEQKTQKISSHFPWSVLLGEEIQTKGYKGEEEFSLTNKLPK